MTKKNNIFPFNDESNWDEFISAIANKHGHNRAGCVTASIGCVGLLIWGLLFAVGLVVCVVIVLDSSRHISIGLFNTLETLAWVFLAIFIIAVGYYGNDIIFFSVRDVIAVLAFIQTLFWVSDSDNPIHEPRSVLLLVVSAGLAYYSEQINYFAERLPLFMSLFDQKAVVPGAETRLPFLEDDEVG